MRIGYCMMMLWLASLSMLMAMPPQRCPSALSQSGFVNDLGLLADTVSWPYDDQVEIRGTCGSYRPILERQGKYDTRLRVYENDANNAIIFSFRPTQETPEGLEIHSNRQLVACQFLNGSCNGLVNDRFQQAFQDLVGEMDSSFYQNISTKHVSTVGHSLGGSLQLFMAIYLFQQFNITPSYVLGFAGPFIGDENFTRSYIHSLKDIVKDNMWQIETIDMDNPISIDGSVEGYNTNNEDGRPNWGVQPYNPLSSWQPSVSSDVHRRTPIYVDLTDICGVEIHPRADAYGLHDFKNYREGFRGTACV